MRKLKPVFVAAAAVVVLGSMYYLKGTSYAYGGMAGMGMMGGSRGANEDTKGTVDSSHADKLLSYIHEQGLGCLQCHSVSAGGFGPSFASVSTRYENNENATSILSDHIEHGIGRMPSGLANNTQAKQLAKLIMELTENKGK